MSTSSNPDQADSTGKQSQGLTRRDVLFGGVGVTAGLTVGVGLGRAWKSYSGGKDVEAQGVAHRAGIDWGERKIIWSASEAVDAVAISFDDGPHPDFTPAVLDVLAQTDTKATFFMLGRQVAEHPDLAKRVRDEGHELANHGWDHKLVTDLDLDEVISDISSCAEEIDRQCGLTTSYWRPPRGLLTGNAVLACGLLAHDIVMWSATRGPSGPSTPEQVAGSVSGEWTTGRILNLHDGLGRATYIGGGDDLRARREVELEALSSILSDARQRGLGVVSVGELVGVQAES